MACDSVIELHARSPKLANAAARAAIEEVVRIEMKYSRYRAGSMVWIINAAAGVAPVDIDDETSHLLDYAAECFEQSDGLFDITSGILRRAWDFRAKRLPARATIERLLPLIAWPRVERTKTQVFLPQAGMELDFGGFGKEYAVDRAAAVLLSFGLRHAFVDRGGDVTVTGPRAEREPWQLGIRHPRNPDCVVARLPIASGGVATSGGYERFMDYNGRRDSHILNPRTGESVAGWQSVTEFETSCMVAGSINTIAMITSATHAATWLARSGAAYFAVDASGLVVSNLERG